MQPNSSNISDNKVPINKKLINSFDLGKQIQTNKTDSLVCLQEQTDKKWSTGDCTKISGNDLKI